MSKPDWHRVTQRQYITDKCTFLGKSGTVSLLTIEKLTAPLVIHYDFDDMLIADVGYSWLQIALQNQKFWITAMYNAQGQLVEIYFDITAGNHVDNTNDPWFEDMYLDVVLLNVGRYYVLDRDELDDAYAAGHIDKDAYNLAIADCEKLCSFLNNNKNDVIEFCEEWFNKLK